MISPNVHYAKSSPGLPGGRDPRATRVSGYPTVLRSRVPPPLTTLRFFGAEFGYNICTVDHGPAQALRVLGHLLRGGLADLSASEQAVYLRLLWLCGFRRGTCRCGVERLVAWTGLSRNTVLAALRRLRSRGLLRPYTREPKRETAWLVEIPEPTLPGLPKGLQEEAEPRGWLADQMDPEDLELARSLVDSLPPARREELEREAAGQFGLLGEEEMRKAILELVARSSFGPDRLRKYGI